MGTAANRLTSFHRLSRSICPQRTHFSIQTRRSEVNQTLKKQLFCLNSSVTQGSHFSGFSAASPQWRKVIQGHVVKPSISRLYSSFEQGCSQNSKIIDKVEKGGQMESPSYSVPNETWTVESRELYKRLTSDLIKHGNGDWCEHKSAIYHGERRLFTKALVHEYPGKFFEYAFFFSKNEQKLKGVVQFGPYTQGPPGCVHGGASASIMDAATGVCVNKSFPACVTASLTTNYKSLLPLGSTAIVESWIDKVEGRKIFSIAELKSPDGKVTYVTANALFIQLQPQGENKHVVDALQKRFQGDKK